MFIPCKRCKATVDGEEFGHYDVSVMGDDGSTPKAWIRYTLYKCPKCSGPMLALDFKLPNETDWSGPIVLYPPGERTADTRLPKSIQECFNEALGCLRDSHYHASAAMCRKTLDGLCKLKGSTKPLALALDELHKAGVIDDTLAKLTEALREDGNLAVHDLDAKVTKEQAEHIVDCTEAVLNYVFILSEKFNAYQKLRGRKAT